MLCILAKTLSVLILSVAFGLTACALFLTKESRYLRSSNNQATEADVRRHLGEPADVTSGETGQTTWVYKTRKRIQQGTNNAWTTFDAWQCDTYTLVFDDKQILRDWTHESRQC